MLPVYLAFAASGAAALIYEITWTRLLTLFMGHTVAAASTVLAAFMGGLGLGAAVAGRWSIRLERAQALRAYAIVETAIAAFAVALPFELSLLGPLLAAAYADGAGGAAFAVVRLTCALLAVTLPAVAMGATLPLMMRWVSASAQRAGRDAGALYAANTVGATVGAVLCGFVLLPALGMRATIFVGVALNGISAATAWWVAANRVPPSGAPSPRKARRATSTPAIVSQPRLAMAAVAISGCVSLILQVAWTRIIALVVGPTTFAFSAMVATFIAGIALGSAAASRLLARPAASPDAVARWLAASLMTAGVGAAVAAAWAPSVPLLIADAVAAPDASFGTVVRLQSLVIAGLMLPMTIAFGAAFPLAVSLAAGSDDTVPRDTANVYTANTIGAIAGALAGGFLVVPWLGLQNTVRSAAGLALAGFVVVALAQAHRRVTTAAGVLAAAAAASIGLAAMPPWQREILSSGAYKYAPYMEGPYRETLLQAGRLLYYREGAAATVSVREVTGTRSLAIDGKVDASNAGDMLTQRLLAHLPLLLHPSPRSVAIIGMGSGVTLGSALLHPVERVDMLEISPEVVEASRFFAQENHDPLADRRTRLIVGDGRSHLSLSRGHYDVIVSEPSNPWMAGVAALFTQEFFESARDRLAPGGVLCQWAHAYDISAEDLRSILATFASVFPRASLWLVGEGDVLLIGSMEPLEPRLDAVARGWSRPGVAADLEAVDVRDSDTLLSLFAAEGAALADFVAGAPIHRDDRMHLEFSGPQGIYGQTKQDNSERLRQLAAEAPHPAAVRAAWSEPTTAAARGVMHLRAQAFRSAFDDFAEALRRNPRDAAAADGVARAAAGARRPTDAEALLRRLLDVNPENSTAAAALSRLIAARGDLAAAAQPLRPLLVRSAPDPRAVEQLASVLADAGDAESLMPVVADLQRLAPDSEAALYYTATLNFMTDRHQAAIAAAERLRERNPGHARNLNVLGAAYATVGRIDDARRTLLESLAADPRDPSSYVNLGTLELQVGRAGDAHRYFVDALTLDPSSDAARQGLERSMAALRRQ